MNRKAVMVIVLLCFISLMGLAAYTNYRQNKHKVSSYEFALDKAPAYGDALQFLEEDFTVSEDFTSHMPLVILDMNGEVPPQTLRFNETTMEFDLIPDLEPYVDGTLAVIDGGSLNRLSDMPSVQSDIIIKRRGNSSMSYDKPQYLVKLQTAMEQENHLELMNMGSNDEWILNGSMSDKSMMRNYLCYRVTSQIMAGTPDAKYCEVLIKNGDTYTYQGVYLLCENIRQGEERVDITKYSPSSAMSSFLVRRDRYDEEQVMLHTYLQEQGLTDTYVGLIYPNKKKVTQETVNYVEQELYKIEKALYADNFNEFSTYNQLIDVDSFVDYFIVNEYFGNYDAGQHSTYMHKEIGEKLKIGPVWDFDGAIDNYQLEPADVNALAFYTAPWFEQLVKDKEFVRKVEKRYSQLRNTVLSDKYIDTLIEDIKGYLGSAREREWKRWEKQYTQDDKVALYSYVDEEEDIIYRELTSYEQEIYRLKTVLRKHGQIILKNMRVFHEVAVWDTRQSVWQAVIFTVCVAIFFFSIIYVNRRDKG